MPSIIPSPGSPGVAPNFDATVDQQGNYSVAAGSTFYTTSLSMMFQSYNPFIFLYTFTNNGTLWNRGPGASVIWSMNYCPIVNNGLMVAEATSGAAQAINVWSSFNGLDNSGRIYALAVDGAAIGVSDYSSVGISNSGLIAALSEQGSAVAIVRYNGGLVRNAASGSILAEGPRATAIALGRGSFWADGYPVRVDIDNAGLIEAASTDPARASVALSLGSYGNESMVVLNSGTIRADVAILAGSISTNDLAQGPKTVTNLATGVIEGDIIFDVTDETLVNQGRINGDLLFFEGNDFYDGGLGLLTGFVDMGWGEDVFIGGANAEIVVGDRGNDQMSGGGGNDLLLGGRGDDLLAGGGGNDGLYGEYGNDRIATLGADRVVAGAGDDRVELGDYSFEKVEGGAGRDILVLAGGAKILDLAAALATGRLAGFEEIRLPGAQHLVVRAADVAALSGGNELIVSAGASGVVDLVGAWAAQGFRSVAGVGYRVYASGGTLVLVEFGAGVSIAPSAPAGATGLDSVAGGGLAPAPGVVPGTDLAQSATVTNGYFGPVGSLIIDADEHWSTQSSALVGVEFTINGGRYWDTITNYGAISAIGNDEGIGGVQLTVARFDNHGSVTASATGSANLVANRNHLNTYGIDNAVFTGGGNVFGLILGTGFTTVRNAGTINVASESSIAAAYATYQLDMVNDGEVRSASSNFVAVGIHSHNGGRLVNNGIIDAVGQIAAYGVRTMTHEAVIENNGTITASARQAGAPAIAVSFYYQTGTSTLINNGTISAATAIQSSWMVNGGGLVLRNGGRIEGLIELNFEPSGAVLGRQDEIYNRGLIIGEVRMGAERDYFDGQGGEVQGRVLGEVGSDLLSGSAGADTFLGGADQDLLWGGAGADTLTGGAGRDVFLYRAASESTAAAFDTIADFETGVDRIDLSALGVTSLTLSPSGGATILNAVTAAGTLSIRISGAISAADVLLSNIAQLDGTAAGDMLVATHGGTQLYGLDGDDFLIGGAGNDRFEGGAGFDLLWGGRGDDLYIMTTQDFDLIRELAGEGNDTVRFIGSYGVGLPDNVENLDLVSGQAGSGNDGANVITGNDEVNQLYGGGGPDVIFAGAGGIDTITGGSGGDRISGGAGADHFIYTALTDSSNYVLRSDGRKFTPDTITDFESGLDKISLFQIDAVAGTPYDEPFTFIGSAAFSHQAGELRLAAYGNQIHVLGDTNGDGTADFHIIVNAATLVASDFLL